MGQLLNCDRTNVRPEMSTFVELYLFCISLQHLQILCHVDVTLFWISTDISIIRVTSLKKP